MGEKGTGNKDSWQVENRQGQVKNSIGHREAKDLICTTHGCELSERMQEDGVFRVKGDKREKNGTSVIA